MLDFPWLETSDDTHGELEMWCSLCRKNNCRPKRAPLEKAVWIKMPCKTITRQSLSDHIESNCMHCVTVTVNDPLHFMILYMTTNLISSHAFKNPWGEP